MTAQHNSSRQPKGSRQYSGRAKSRSVQSDDTLWASFCDLPKNVGWQKNAVVYRVVFRKVDSGWQALVKAERAGSFGIAYVDGRSFPEMLEVLTLKIGDGSMNWSIDDYPP